MTTWTNRIAVEFPDGSLSSQPAGIEEDKAIERARYELKTFNGVSDQKAKIVRITIAIAETEIE